MILRVSTSDYVINATDVATSTNCFGAPVLHVGAGEVVYLRDVHSYHECGAERRQQRVGPRARHAP